ncbi:MAG: TRAP transporter large permease [Desulfobacteraceae bacterium]|jgi:tripartite ATP-independent transporter DctM subunit
MGLFLLIVFVALMLMGMPIGFVMGLTALYGFFYLDNPTLLTMLSQKFFSGMNSFALLALPFFILAGDIMTKVGLTGRLVDFSNIFFGRFRGGLAQVNIVTSIIFGGISGSAAADTAALGSIFIPSMTDEGYDREFSTAVTVASSIIAPIIPPSMIMVIYGALMGVSIAGLFAAGLVPGLMLGVFLMIYTRFVSKKRNYPKHKEKVTAKRIWVGTKRAVWGLIMPAIILGGILGGVFTPTEAAAIAVGYALFLGLVAYRNLSLKDLFDLFYRNAVLLGVIGLILSSASILAWLLAAEQIPEMVAKGFLAITHNKYIILLLINLFLIFIGMFMDITASLIILGPILAPLAIDIGVHPLHFGIMMCVNLYIALITPPMGGCLFLAMAISKLNMGQLLKALWPFLLIEFAVLFIVVYIPEVTMFVPRLLGFL